jgi:DNA-binding HxlR family transcriptional regulator
MIVWSVPEKRRNYRQFCGMARALDRVGERWTLPIVRNLLLGSRRYSDLLHELPGITTNLLAKRLREMSAAGLIERTWTDSPARVPVYALTELGAALEPVIMELGRWGGRFMGEPNEDDTVNIGWGLLSIKRRYRGGLCGIVEFRVGVRFFELDFQPASLRVTERQPTHPRLCVAGALESFQLWLFKGTSPHDLRTQDRLQVRGDEPFFRELASAFEPPRARV